MKPNGIGSIFWMVQFVNICIVASRTLGSHDSCPCVPSTSCPDDFQLSIDYQVLMLSCESRNLVRCCSTKRRSIELTHTSESPWDPENTLLKINETEADTTELNIPMHIKENVEEDVTTESLANVASVEESTWDVPVNIHEAEDLSNEDANVTEGKNYTFTDSVDDSTEMTQNMLNDMDSTDVNRVPLQHPRTELPPQPRLALVKTQNEEIPNSPRFVSFTASEDHKMKKGRLAKPILYFQQDEEESDVLDLIREVKFFESRRTAPKKPDLLQNIPRRINSAPSKAVVLTKGYFNMNPRALSAAQRLSEKMSDLTKQKTLLETALTPNRVSAQATNENASSVSELDVAQHDDTSIRNLSHPEDVDDVKRVARSHASEPNEEPKEDRRSKSLSRRAKTGNQAEAEAVPVKPFKRPPRVLPVKHLSKEESDSNKFANPRERAISLFNKSNETRRKQVSLLANRNDSNLSKINSSKSSSATTEQTETTETESSTSDGSMNLLIEENVS